MTLFEGREVDAITVKLKAHEVPTSNTYHHGSEVYVLVRAEVTDIQHPEKDGTLFRCHVAKPDDAWIVPQLTAARMIDAVEPPKLPGTEREADVPPVPIDRETGELVPEVEQIDDDGSTVTLEDDAKIDLDIAAAESEPIPGPDPVEPEQTPAPTGDEEPLAAPPAAEGPRPATPEQRVALSKQIHNIDEAMTKEFVQWCQRTGSPLNPGSMSEEQAMAALVLLGERP